MEEMLRIEDIVENKQVLPFFINSQVDMLDFVYPHKMVVRRRDFQSFQIHETELEGEV
jgi:hypothetical protein